MRNYIAFVILCLLFQAGCSQSPALVEGGTAGSLLAGETPVPDVEVKIYAAGDSTPLGFGATNHEGKFRLVSPKGEGPLWLSPGDYVFTLESLGPVPPPLSPAYASALKTPLKATWKSSDQSFDLKIPKLK
jgi:hypothetical protein